MSKRRAHAVSSKRIEKRKTGQSAPYSSTYLPAGYSIHRITEEINRCYTQCYFLTSDVNAKLYLQAPLTKQQPPQSAHSHPMRPALTPACPILG
jgi:hypothetical protein